MVNERHDRNQDTTSGLTMDSIAYVIRSELRQGMEQQQRCLSEKTRGTLEEGLAPICARIGDVENKVAEGIKTTHDDIQELNEGQERLEMFLSQTRAGTELLQQRILALEEKLAEFQQEAGPCNVSAPASRTRPQHRTGTPQAPPNFASCSLALSEVGFFSSARVRSTNPTPNGTVVTSTTTSATWHSSGRTTPMAEKQKCRRCTQGPSWHGGHNRADPTCVLHGSTARNGGEALAYLRRHTRPTGTTARSSGSTPTTSTTRAPTAPTARSTGSTPATSTTRTAPKRGRAKRQPKGPQRSQPHGPSLNSDGAAAARKKRLHYQEEDSRHHRRLRGPGKRSPSKARPNPSRRGLGARKMRSSNEKPGTPSLTLCPTTPTNRNHHPRPPRQHEGTKAAKAANQSTKPVQRNLPSPLELSGESPPLKLEQPGPSHR